MLTDTAVRNAKPREKPFKLTDGGGLYVFVNPNGSRWWRFRYRVQGREKLISLGVYPEISLREARERRDEAKKLHKSGVDPSVRRQIEQKVTAETFEAIAREWFAKFSGELGAESFGESDSED